MTVEILTREDLAAFKAELFQELRELINFNAPTIQPKKWIKTYEVREMLGLSPGTLQNMRVNGTLSFTRIGGLIYYDYDDILKLMEGNQKPVKRS
ncbi:helix-turn-helix protein [Chitinophaga polysaccharea]|uniref:Helix-turn-helix protein n=1 Tax=Chitinophaga polysaccharea TaxID=1293035 RepID=A0A561PN71_9BACT|nr:helix-turn-helix domain-containing protein [Chitinophaga polysaccharea]NLR58879.1 helix-turn-helix domain-containing protein [Chitinophaga polysaccharea]TWF39572.1 helix-turn-helix protein [Chitinophaga polysaccharea]